MVIAPRCACSSRRLGPDSANNRRAIRSLLDRGLLEEREEDGTRLVALTLGGR